MTQREIKRELVSMIRAIPAKAQIEGHMVQGVIAEPTIIGDWMVGERLVPTDGYSLLIRVNGGAGPIKEMGMIRR